MSAPGLFTANLQPSQGYSKTIYKKVKKIDQLDSAVYLAAEFSNASNDSVLENKRDG